MNAMWQQPSARQTPVVMCEAFLSCGLIALMHIHTHALSASVNFPCCVCMSVQPLFE